MEIICFKIPSNLKQSMKEIDIDWNKEIVQFIRAKVKEYEEKKARELWRSFQEEFMKSRREKEPF